MKINIWDDYWIPNRSSMKIIIVRGNCVLSTVNELINPTTGEWDESLIRDNFWHIDAERISQIPIYTSMTRRTLLCGTSRNQASLVSGQHTTGNGRNAMSQTTPIRLVHKVLHHI